MLALVILSYWNDENKLYHPWLLVFCDCCAKTIREPNSVEPSEKATKIVYQNPGTIVTMIDSCHNMCLAEFWIGDQIR